MKEIYQKLDAFIRKYYTGQFISRSFIALGMLLTMFVLISLLEHFYYFSSISREWIFFAFLFYALVVLTVFSFIPLGRLLGVIKRMDRAAAAKMIGKHFPEIDDKLLNMLQLEDQLSEDDAGKDLILASIEQRSADMGKFSFKEAVRLKSALKTFWIASVPLLLVLLISAFQPSVIQESTHRLVHYNTHFEKPLPFQVKLLNKELQSIQHQDFVLQVEVKGDEVPAQIYIDRDGKLFPLIRQNGDLYQYTFRQPDHSMPFQLKAGEYESEHFVLKVVPQPVISEFEVSVQPPAYTALPVQTYQNTGDLSFPEGSVLKWKFYGRDVEHLSIIKTDSLVQIPKDGSNVFQYVDRILSSTPYSVVASNQYMASPDTLQFFLQTIPDEYPQIAVGHMADSLNYTAIYFQGRISDDYGFSSLNFFYQVKKEGESEFDSPQREKVSIPSAQLESSFYHQLDLSKIGMKAGDELQYYFEVSDNDQVNGPKLARSQTKHFLRPSKEMIKQQKEELKQSYTKRMESALKESQRIDIELQSIKEDLFSKAEWGWQEKEKVKDLINRKNALQEEIKEMQSLREEMQQQENQLDALPEDLLKKQEELDKLMEDLLSDDMKEMIQELQELMEKFDPKKMAEMMEQMEMKQEDLEQQLDKNLEFFKRLEMEKDITEAVDELKQLADKQEELSEQSEDKSLNSDSLQNLQQELNKEFEEWKKEMDQLQDENQQLSQPHALPNQEAMEQEIELEMQEATDQLGKSKESKAAKHQKNAKQKMQKMGDNIMGAMQQQQAQQQAEDARLIRQLLDNLLYVSFKQESIIHEMQRLQRQDPQFISLMHEQSQLKRDVGMVKDSLLALAKRQRSVRKYIHDETAAAERELNKTLDLIEKGRLNEISTTQQYAMTAVNNLALMLSEVLDQMDKQKNGNPMSGQGSCSNSKGQSPKPGSMKDLQKQLGEQMKKMQDALKKGKNQMQGKSGQQAQQMSEQFARMAAQQAEIRRQMQSYAEELKKQGLDAKNIEKALKEANEIEQELIYKDLSDQALFRQQEIMNRLLQEERAELEREKDDRRESKEASPLEMQESKMLEEYLKKQQEEVEMLRSLPAEMRPFYKQKTKRYFFELNSKQK